MKKHIKPALLLSLLFCCAGCSSIDVRCAFDFGVETLPYRQTLEEGGIAEVYFEIVPGEAGCLHDSTRYSVRYFPSEGEGQLRLRGDSMMRPNVLYRLPGRQFVMTYMPDWGKAASTHTLELVFIDSYEHHQAVTLTFNQQHSESDEK